MAGMQETQAQEVNLSPNNGQEFPSLESIEMKMIVPQFAQNLLKKLYKFREESLFCDFVIDVENKSFKVHKAIMAGCSDYFQAMLSHDMMETRQEKVELPSLTITGTQPLVEYAYTGELMISLDSLPEILAAANFLQMTSAVDLCVQYMERNLTYDNAESMLLLAETFNISHLASYHHEMVLNNFLDFAETEAFLKLDAGTLADYLSQDSLSSPTEGKLLKKALAWYDYDKDKREKEVFNVLEKIRYTWDGWPLIQYCSNKEPFISNPECRRLIEWSEMYMQSIKEKPIRYNHWTRTRYHCKALVQIGGLFALGIGDGEAYEKNHYLYEDKSVWHKLGASHYTSQARSHCPMVEVNNDYAILCGGYVYQGNNSGETLRRCSSEVKLFTSSCCALFEFPELRDARAEHIAVYIPGTGKKKLKGSVYVVGGRNDRRRLRSVERYELGSNRWNFAKWLEKSVYGHAGAAHQKHIYISGGIQERRVSKKVEVYSPTDNLWTEAPSMLEARCNHTMSALGERLIVCGGRPDQTGHCLDTVEMYDVELCQWSSISGMLQPCADMTAVVLENKLLVIGGEDPDGRILDSIYEYNPESEDWAFYTHLNYPLSNASCAAIVIKQSEDGEQETDSIMDEAEQYGQAVFSDDIS